MFDLSQIPDEASALVSVFRANGHGDEFLATLAVDPDPIFLTPFWKCVRVDVDALDDFPGLNRFLFEFLGTLEPIFPFARHFVAVLRNSPDCGIIFLAKPADANHAEERIIEGAHGFSP
jgi:hypothetical protein